MKYECLNPNCKKRFSHTATIRDRLYVKTEDPHPADTEPTHELSVSVCPFCFSPNFDEIQNESPLTNVKIVKAVPHAEVEEIVKQGFVVHAIYAKETVLIKKDGGIP